jgi:Winged helix DNA-binding domain
LDRGRRDDVQREVAARVLAQRELNRALLARQLLLERARLPLPRAVERMGGIQAQYAPSSYIGLWSRVDGFDRDSLTRALTRRTLVQATLLRGTIHIVSRRDYWPWLEAIRKPTFAWFRRVAPSADHRRLRRDAEKVRTALGDGPRRRDELVALVGKDRWPGVNLYVDLVRVPPSGTWEHRRADLYALADDWLGPSDASADEGVELLARRYLGAFGPARVADIQNWGRLDPGDLKAALGRLDLRWFRDEEGKELVDLPRGALPPPETPAPARFVPTWDAMLLVHARRTGVLPESFRPLIFNTRLPFSMHTFLVDGVVAGSWRYEDGRVTLESFRELSRAERRELDDEAERLAVFHG